MSNQVYPAVDNTSELSCCHSRSQAADDDEVPPELEKKFSQFDSDHVGKKSLAQRGTSDTGNGRTVRASSSECV